MTRCGPATSCACVVQSGTGIGVTGDGTPGSPYVVQLAGALAAYLGVTDSASIDFTLTGNGTAGSPWALTATVKPDTVTPNANATLDIVGAKIAEGLDYDETTRSITVLLSADAGNALALGDDGGLYIAPGAVEISEDDFNELFVGDDDGLIVRALDMVSGQADNMLFPVGADQKLWVGSSGWVKAEVTELAPLRVDIIGGSFAQLAEVAYPADYTPVVDDTVYAIPPGVGGTKFLILGIAPA